MSDSHELPKASTDLSQKTPSSGKLEVYEKAQEAARTVLAEYDKTIKQFLKKHGNSWPAGSETSEKFAKLMDDRTKAHRDVYYKWGFIDDQIPDKPLVLAAWIEQQFTTPEMVATANRTNDTGEWAQKALHKGLEYAMGIIESDPSLPQLPKDSVDPIVALRSLHEWCIRCQSFHSKSLCSAQQPCRDNAIDGGTDSGVSKSAKKSATKRGTRAANIEKIKRELKQLHQRAKAKVKANIDQKQIPELLPRPSKKNLAKQLGISRAGMTRCFQDSSELRQLYERLCDLDFILYDQRSQDCKKTCPICKDEHDFTCNIENCPQVNDNLCADCHNEIVHDQIPPAE